MALACTASLFLGLPGSASATHVWLGGSVYRLFAKGSNGYTFRLSSYRNRLYHRISLTAESSDGQYVRYSVQGVPKRGRIDAVFPGIGKIDVLMHPKKVVELPPPKGCKLPKTVIHYGLFEGTINLRGERGYSNLEAERVPGRIETSQRQQCQLASPARLRPGGGIRSFTNLNLVTGHVTVHATADAGDSEAYFSATARERRKGMGIVRSSPEVSSAGDFEANSELTWATASPPPPFLGTATYSGPPRSTGCAFPCPFPFGQVEGSLRLPLPGLGVIPLTGPQVTAQLTEQWIAFD